MQPAKASGATRKRSHVRSLRVRIKVTSIVEAKLKAVNTFRKSRGTKRSTAAYARRCRSHARALARIAVVRPEHKIVLVDGCCGVSINLANITVLRTDGRGCVLVRDLKIHRT